MHALIHTCMHTNTHTHTGTHTHMHAHTHLLLISASPGCRLLFANSRQHQQQPTLTSVYLPTLSLTIHPSTEQYTHPPSNPSTQQTQTHPPLNFCAKQHVHPHLKEWMIIYYVHKKHAFKPINPSTKQNSLPSWLCQSYLDLVSLTLTMSVSPWPCGSHLGLVSFILSLSVLPWPSLTVTMSASP